MGVDKYKVLFASAEMVPFAKVGGLADVVGSLPQALNRLGHDARVVLPNYRRIEKGYKLKELVSGLTVELGDEKVPVGIKVIKHGGLRVYLVDCPRFFDRDGIYMHPDDGERFIVFCRGVLEGLRRLDWKPDLIHANDWQTALIPCYLKTALKDDPFYKDMRSVFTIHNLAYQGLFPPSFLELAGIDKAEFHYDKLEFYGQVNLMKGGIVYADQVNTVSERYRDEIQTPEFGERLDGLLSVHSGKLSGIVNGIDVELFNPLKDKNIASKYTKANVSGKEENKEALLRELGLPYRKTRRIPLLAMVTRLAAQKGLDLVEEAFPSLIKMDMQFVLLGTGDPGLEKFFKVKEKMYPDRVSVQLRFDAALAQRIYAGSDIFLMPSRFEPCGLGQLISLRYGTIPVARRTGGLADTIVPFNRKTKRGTGFVFDKYTTDALVRTVKKAAAAYKDKKVWTQLKKNAMSADFSWDASARKYVTLYRRALAGDKTEERE
ncbi:MAG: glycogen synthase GlgA [bacterium]